MATKLPGGVGIADTSRRIAPIAIDQLPKRNSTRSGRFTVRSSLRAHLAAKVLLASFGLGSEAQRKSGSAYWLATRISGQTRARRVSNPSS